MKKGYQLLLKEPLDDFSRWPHQHVMLVAILHWLVEKLNLELKVELKNAPAQLEVIKAQYVGDGYPTIGIHYFNRENPDDIGPIVEATIERLLKERSMLDFVEYAGKGDVNWNDVLIKLMNPSSDP
jgi:hypothetical protein